MSSVSFGAAAQQQPPQNAPSTSNLPSAAVTSSSQDNSNSLPGSISDSNDAVNFQIPQSAGSQMEGVAGPANPDLQQPATTSALSQTPGASSSAGASSSNSNSNSRLTPEITLNGLQPPPSVTEDGYLGDCSSDGENKKNFPMPAYLVKRLVNGKTCPCHPQDKLLDQQQLMQHTSPTKARPSGSTERPQSSSFEAVDPPAGLAFQNLAASGSSFGYQVLPSAPPSFAPRASSASRKMRSALRSRLAAHSSANNWTQMKATLNEKRLRMAATTNNTETLAKLLANGANVNSGDEHQRTALHFSAAKGYAEAVKILIQHGANVNAKDALGNTALHLAACTHHIEVRRNYFLKASKEHSTTFIYLQVVTLLLRGGTDIRQLDNNGRTPFHLAQSKLRLLQKNSNTSEVGKVKTEVALVVDMMREYLTKTCANSDFSQLLNSFSQRLTLHNNQEEIHSDLQNLLDSLGSLTLSKS